MEISHASCCAAWDDRAVCRAVLAPRAPRYQPQQAAPRRVCSPSVQRLGLQLTAEFSPGLNLGETTNPFQWSVLRAASLLLVGCERSLSASTALRAGGTQQPCEKVQHGWTEVLLGAPVGQARQQPWGWDQTGPPEHIGDSTYRGSGGGGGWNKGFGRRRKRLRTKRGAGGRLEQRSARGPAEGWAGGPRVGCRPRGGPLFPPSPSPPPLPQGRAGPGRAAAPLPPRGRTAAPRPRAAAAFNGDARLLRPVRPVLKRPRPWRARRCRCCCWRWGSPPPPSPRTSRSCSTAASAAGSTGKRRLRSARGERGEKKQKKYPQNFFFSFPLLVQLPGCVCGESPAAIGAVLPPLQLFLPSSATFPPFSQGFSFLPP